MAVMMTKGHPRKPAAYAALAVRYGPLRVEAKAGGVEVPAPAELIVTI
jgi:hypothetical protein